MKKVILTSQMHLAKTPLADEDRRPFFPKSLLLRKKWYTTGCEWERHQTDLIDRRRWAVRSPQDNLSELPEAETPYVLLGPEIEPVPPGWMARVRAFLLMPALLSSKHLWCGHRRERERGMRNYRCGLTREHLAPRGRWDSSIAGTRWRMLLKNKGEPGTAAGRGQQAQC